MNINDLYREFVKTFSRGAATVGKTKVIKLSGADVGATTSVYAAGDAIGGKKTLSGVFLSSNGQATLMSVVVGDGNQQKSDLELLFFDADPSGSTITENNPVSISADELSQSAGSISIVAADYKDYAANSVATKTNIGMPIWNNSGDTGMYLAVISRGTPTYTANGLSISLTFYQDA